MRRPARTACLAASVGAMLANAGCANRGSDVRLVDQLLAEERRVHAARTTDFDTVVRFAAAVPDVLESSCAQSGRARVDALEERVHRVELAQRAHFETLVWTLQWERLPRASAQIHGAQRHRVAASATAALAARAEADRHPNDARLAARAAVAEAEHAERRSELLGAERATVDALAERIRPLRTATRARIHELLSEIAVELQAAGVVSCRSTSGIDPAHVEARRAAYAELYTARVEGLLALRAQLARPDDAHPVVVGPPDALPEPLAFGEPVLPVDPAFEARLVGIEQRIRSAERDLTSWIDLAVGELSAGLAPGS